MTTPALLIPRLSFIGLGKETTMGTFHSATVYIPGERYAPDEQTAYDDDASMQGNSTRLQGVVQGIKDSAFGFDCKLYWELLGHFFVALGYADTIATGRTVTDGADTSSTTITSASAAFTAADVGETITGTDIPASTTIASVTNATTAVLSQAATGTGSSRTWVLGTSGTTRHLFKQASAGTQPPTYSITDFNQLTSSTGTRGYPGMMLDQMDLTAQSKELLKLSLSWNGWSSASQSKPTPTYPTITPGHGWQSAYTINSSSNKNILGATFSFANNADGEHTAQNSQDPIVTFAGDKGVSAKVDVMAQDETELGYYLNNTQPAFVMTLTSPSGSPAPVLTLTGTKSIWRKGTVDRSGKYIMASFDVDFAYNATDNGPMQMLLTNGVSTSYSA
jgi:hypothetical protein